MTKSANARCFSFQPLFEDCKCDLENYGYIVPVFPDKRPSVYDKRISALIEQALEKHNYDPDKDYIVVVKGHITGLALLVGVVTAKYGQVKALLFSSESRQYVESTIGLDVVIEEGV